MSGSGATCFALFADREAALEAAAVLARAEPLWWSAGGALMNAAPPERDTLAGTAMTRMGVC
jgi:4-diphosphocytidyl-2C-methyl-D-erythritol kinase